MVEPVARLNIALSGMSFDTHEKTIPSVGENNSSIRVSAKRCRSLLFIVISIFTTVVKNSITVKNAKNKSCPDRYSCPYANPWFHDLICLCSLKAPIPPSLVTIEELNTDGKNS